MPARGGICMGERSAPVRGGSILRRPASAPSAAVLSYCIRPPPPPLANRQQGAPRRAPARLPGMAAVPPPARCYARAPQKSFEASSGTGRSPPAFEECLAALPQDMLSEQCERSNCKLFANDILLPTGEGVWGAEYRSPKVGAPAPGRVQPARGGICMGERSAPVRGGPFCRHPLPLSPPPVYPPAPSRRSDRCRKLGKTKNTGNTMNTE